MVAWNTATSYGKTCTTLANTGGDGVDAPNVTDDLRGTENHFGSGVFGGGTFYRGFVVDLGEPMTVEKVSLCGGNATGSGFSLWAGDSIAGLADTGATFSESDFDIWDTSGFDPAKTQNGELRTFVLAAPTVARYWWVRESWTQGGLAFRTGFWCYGILLNGTPLVVVPKAKLTIGAVEVERPLELSCRVELNLSGSGHFRISRGDAQATEALLARGAKCAVTFPEIDPDPIFEFFLQDGDFALISSDEEGGEELAFSGPGTLTYLGRAVLDFQEFDVGAGVVRPSRGIWTWGEQKTEGYIVKKMIEEAQDPDRLSDPIPALTTSFSYWLDSNGVAWGDQTLEGTWREKIGTNMLEAILRLVRAGLMQIEMAPGYVLHLYRSIGRDLTGVAFGTGVVRFAQGVNIASELSRSMAGIRFASHAVVRYGDGSYLHAVKDGGTPYDQETYIESNSDNATTARRQAKGLMRLREDAQEGILFEARVPWPGAGNNEAAGIYLPGPAWTDNGRYWVGDLVTLHTGTGEFDWDNATKRIVAIILRMDETGHLAPPGIELGARYIASGRSQLPQLSDSLGTIAGASGGGGAGSTTGSGTVLGFSAWKEPVVAATTGNITISTALNAGDILDGRTLADGNRVLVKDQTNPAENGIYQVGVAPSRMADFDSGDEVLGAMVRVIGGTVNAGTTWRVTNTTEPVIDTDDITFEEFEAGGSDTTLVTVADAGPAETIDVSVARTYDLTLTEDCTLTLSGAVTAEAWFVTVLLRQGGTGGWGVTWPGSVEWPGGVTPTLSTTAGDVDVFTLFTLDGGTTWFGFPTGGTGTGPLALDDLTDVAITSATEGDALRYRTGEWVNEALTIPTATVLIPVDTGTPTYDTTGDNVEVTVATVWGLDVDDPYYDAAGALGGEEAALFWDPENLIYVLLPFNFPVGGS